MKQLTAPELQLLLYTQRCVLDLYADILDKNKVAPPEIKNDCRIAYKSIIRLEKNIRLQLPVDAWHELTNDMKSDRTKDLLLLFEEIKDIEIMSLVNALKQNKKL